VGSFCRDVLRVDGPNVAAQHFTWLVPSIPMNIAMFDRGTEFSQEVLEHHADEGAVPSSGLTEHQRRPLGRRIGD
jgi:hypothetical protein